VGNLVGGGGNLGTDDVEHPKRIRNLEVGIQQGFSHGLNTDETRKMNFQIRV
jgi:hypothetical protein